MNKKNDRVYAEIHLDAVEENFENMYKNLTPGTKMEQYRLPVSYRKKSISGDLPLQLHRRHGNSEPTGFINPFLFSDMFSRKTMSFLYRKMFVRQYLPEKWQRNCHGQLKNLRKHFQSILRLIPV